jgi:hypothetical protein
MNVRLFGKVLEEGGHSTSWHASKIANVREVETRHRWWTLRMIVDELNINKEMIRQILHEDSRRRRSEKSASLTDWRQAKASSTLVRKIAVFYFLRRKLPSKEGDIKRVKIKGRVTVELNLRLWRPFLTVLKSFLNDSSWQRFSTETKNVSISLRFVILCSHQSGIITLRSCTNKQTKQTPWLLIRERTISTEWPPLVDEI